MTISIMRGKGQLTLPKEVREATHLAEGDPVRIEVTAEGILLRPLKIVDSTQAWFWTPKWQASEAAASADIAEGRTTIHKTTEDFLAALGE